ncbi:MAG: hypothetical protein NPIRA01_40850 [Nitrospirales bacterium]|nr:MAG: hypothetical protein NPIRA01_40850 [Nitrospirales bacterium]
MAVCYRIVLQARAGQGPQFDRVLRECGAVRVEAPVFGYLVGYGPHQLSQAVRERLPDAVVSEDTWAETDIEHTSEKSLCPGQVVMVAMPDGWTMTGLLEKVSDGQAEVLMVVFDHPQRVTVGVEQVQVKPLPEPWC